eukprot:SAG31_NODE_2407_length_5761_cov_7.258742_5_plen_462_part_01
MAGPSHALAFLAALSGLVSLPGPARSQRFWSVLREGDLWWLQRDGKTSLSLGMGGLSTEGECCCGNVPPSSPRYCSPAGCLASTCAMVPEVPANELQWELATAQTVKSLGFNTAGSWSDTVWATKGLLPMSVPVLNMVVPYLAQANLSAHFPDWSNGHATLFPDVFGALFARTAREVAEHGVAPLVNNTDILGFFTDSELAWFANPVPNSTFILGEYLLLPSTAPGRIAAQQWLEKQYGGSVASLEASWNLTNCKSFDTLAEDCLPREWPLTERKGFGADVPLWEYQAARKYFQVTHDAIRATGSQHLILGVKFSGHFDEPVARAMAEYVDVASLDFYGDLQTAATDPRTLMHSMYSLSGLPIMIGEFSARATLDDDGTPCNAPSTCPPSGPGMPTFRTQQERSDYYYKYLSSVLGLPFGIGLHWFKWYDEPSLGRPKYGTCGENSNFGLMRSNRTMYKELA